MKSSAFKRTTPCTVTGEADSIAVETSISPPAIHTLLTSLLRYKIEPLG